MWMRSHRICNQAIARCSQSRTKVTWITLVTSELWAYIQEEATANLLCWLFLSMIPKIQTSQCPDETYPIAFYGGTSNLFQLLCRKWGRIFSDMWVMKPNIQQRSFRRGKLSVTERWTWHCLSRAFLFPVLLFTNLSGLWKAGLLFPCFLTYSTTWIY